MESKKKFCILVVDDDMVMRRLCMDAFTAAGYRVATAENGGVAFDRLKLTTYDVIVSDIEMPVMDGIELYRNAVNRHSYLKDRFIFMTGSLSAPVVSSISRLDVEVVHKPFRLADLIGKIDAITESIKTTSGEEFRKQRRSERVTHTEDCFVTEKVLNIPVYSQTVDISEHGLRISYVGRPFVIGSPLKLFITRLGLSATGSIVWSRPLDGFRSVSGVEFECPMTEAKLRSLDVEPQPVAVAPG